VVAVFIDFPNSPDTISSVLFVEKVPKLLGEEKLVRSAHHLSFSHLTQAVPSPKPR
jgi:hypothetical protein